MDEYKWDKGLKPSGSPQFHYVIFVVGKVVLQLSIF